MPSRAGQGETDAAVQALDDAAAMERWRSHHYRRHRGEIEDCPALACQAYMEVATRA